MSSLETFSAALFGGLFCTCRCRDDRGYRARFPYNARMGQRTDISNFGQAKSCTVAEASPITVPVGQGHGILNYSVRRHHFLGLLQWSAASALASPVW